MAPEMLVVGGDANGAYSEMPAGRIGATCGRQAGRDGRLRWPHPRFTELNYAKAFLFITRGGHRFAPDPALA